MQVTVEQVTAFLNYLLDKEIAAATSGGLTFIATELTALKALLASSPNIVAMLVNGINAGESEIVSFAGSAVMKLLTAWLGAGSLTALFATSPAAPPSK